MPGDDPRASSAIPKTPTAPAPTWPPLFIAVVVDELEDRARAAERERADSERRAA